MARLFPRLPFVPDETPLSWAARLAAFHTGGRLVPFLNDLGIALMDLVAGATEAITRLCDIADQDPEPVLRNTIHALGERRFLLRDEPFAAEMTTGPETRFARLAWPKTRRADIGPTPCAAGGSSGACDRSGSARSII